MFRPTHSGLEGRIFLLGPSEASEFTLCVLYPVHATMYHTQTGTDHVRHLPATQSLLELGMAAKLSRLLARLPDFARRKAPGFLTDFKMTHPDPPGRT